MSQFSPLFSQNYRLILASGSPRRRDLLAAVGLNFTVKPPGEAVDETPYPNEAPAPLVQRLSQAKAQAALTQLDQAERPLTSVVILAADTVVTQNGEILGKPASPAEAATVLKSLRQAPHQVYSGLTVIYLPDSASAAEARRVTRYHRSQVWMRPYTNAEIEAYVATGSPMDKAGAYGIQDESFAPVARLEGCFAGVMGLPLGEVAAAWRALGLTFPPVAAACQAYSGATCCQSPTASTPFLLSF